MAVNNDVTFTMTTLALKSMEQSDKYEASYSAAKAQFMSGQSEATLPWDLLASIGEKGIDAIVKRFE